MTEPDRAVARRLAHDSLAKGDATGWFETLYNAARGNESRVPWADMRVNPNLASWLDQRQPDGQGKRALVIGCGLGDDAEELARLGFQVTAFDISASAIAWCQRRFPRSSVDYCVADLISPPGDWRGAFDLVAEVYTLQVLPAELRAVAATQLAGFVAPGGTLLIVARGREPTDDPGSMPWPLTKHEFAFAAACGLETVAFEDYLDGEEPPVRRFRVECRRSQ